MQMLNSPVSLPSHVTFNSMSICLLQKVGAVAKGVKKTAKEIWQHSLFMKRNDEAVVIAMVAGGWMI
uniref:Protein kinase domain-containing protein n=1 Tax=Steinernema glaseri TaxID=37863 RepID=A0A1I8ALL0_9BILA